MNNWKEIWNNKINSKTNLKLADLIKSDGFDSGAGSFDENSWNEYLNLLSKTIPISERDSIFEFGCGSGAFLYPFYLKSHNVGGLDYSKSLIKMAIRAMPNMIFNVEDAVNFEINETYDVVLSHSVFHYFPNLSYTEQVIKKMFKMAKKKVVILDISDETKIDESIKIRTGALKNQNYKEKYQGLDHLYYNKSWFREISENMNYNIKIYDQDYHCYLNSKFRFNVIYDII